MDCEKFEAVMLDELYDELDELTSAAAKRHLAGCARCAAVYNGLRATRRVAVLARLEPPADLEERILSATKNVQKVVPLSRRISGAISWAGNWAMRPQTAMAAVFLLMIGSSLLFLRGKSRSPTSAMHVTEEGTPAPAGTMVQEQASDDGFVAVSPTTGLPPEPKKGSLPSGSVALADEAKKDKDVARRKEAREAEKASEPVAMAELGNAGPVAGAPMPPAAMPPPAAGPSPADEDARLPARMAAGNSATRAGGGEGVLQATGGDFATAMAAYQRGAYDEALRGFDKLAPGDVNAALWAARSARNGSPRCPGAVSRFDDVTRRAPGTITGWDALLEGGQCYRLMGSLDAARSRLTQLLSVPSHAERARQELQWLSPSTGPASKAAASPHNSQQQGVKP